MSLHDLLLVYDSGRRWFEGVLALFFAGDPPLLSQ